RRPQITEHDRCDNRKQHLQRRVCVESFLERIGRGHIRGRSYAAREVFFSLPRIFVNLTATTTSRAREWHPPIRSRTLPPALRPPHGDRSKGSSSSSAGCRVFHQRAGPARKCFPPRESRPAAA